MNKEGLIYFTNPSYKLSQLKSIQCFLNMKQMLVLLFLMSKQFSSFLISHNLIIIWPLIVRSTNDINSGLG